MVLRAIVAETSVTLDLDGNLVITDIEGGTSDDTLTIQVNVDNQQFIISDPNLILTTDIENATGDLTNTVIVPFDEVAGTIIFVNTLGGNDKLTLDYSLGYVARQRQSGRDLQRRHGQRQPGTHGEHHSV